ncbi:MAG: DUF4143 domain-containing protein [Actinobacteria bacterium]|nr:DUF4143 domain-containing protein [Actinomycetota bacterium]
MSVLAIIYYWLNRNREIDFVFQSGKTLVAIEIKSGKKKYTLEGMEEFCRGRQSGIWDIRVTQQGEDLRKNTAN